jgi:hypothetical protein
MGSCREPKSLDHLGLVGLNRLLPHNLVVLQWTHVTVERLDGAGVFWGEKLSKIVMCNARDRLSIQADGRLDER